MPHAANSPIMGTVVRVLLVGVIILMPGGLLLLPLLALYQLRQSKKTNDQSTPDTTAAART